MQCSGITGVNGDFETGDFTGWTLSGDTSYTSVSAAGAHLGNSGAYVGPVYNYGFLTQALGTLSAGVSYTVSFWLKNDGNPNNAFSIFLNPSASLTVLNSAVNGPGPGLDVNTPGIANVAPFDWTQYSYTVVSSADAAVDFQVKYLHVPSFWGFDDVAVTCSAPVPEPTPEPVPVPEPTPEPAPEPAPPGSKSCSFSLSDAGAGRRRRLKSAGTRMRRNTLQSSLTLSTDCDNPSFFDSSNATAFMFLFCDAGYSPVDPVSVTSDCGQNLAGSIPASTNTSLGVEVPVVVDPGTTSCSGTISLQCSLSPAPAPTPGGNPMSTVSIPQFSLTF